MLERYQIKTCESLDAVLEALETAPIAELRAQWLQVLRRPPPPQFRRSALIKGLAYALQAQRSGDLAPRLRRELRTLAQAQAPGGQPKPSAGAAYAPGARLLRSWRGELHEVTVKAEGFEWKGDTYRSLSRVAFEITGTKWNGLRFFGVRSAARDVARG